MPVPTLSGNKYFLIFIDDFLIMYWICFLRNKSNVFQVFRKYNAIVELQSGFKLKRLRTNKGREFTSLKFTKFCESFGMENNSCISSKIEWSG